MKELQAVAVVRVRGTVNLRKDIKATLAMLMLTKVNHCVVIPQTESYHGMLQKVKDYVTWGEVELETLAELLKKRGKLRGGESLSLKWLKTHTKYSSFKELASAYTRKDFHDELKFIKPVLRLSPPKGGYEGIKRAYQIGGALGYRGKEINKLLKRMI